MRSGWERLIIIVAGAAKGNQGTQKRRAEEEEVPVPEWAVGSTLLGLPMQQDYYIIYYCRY